MTSVIDRYLVTAMGNRTRTEIKDKTHALGKPIFDHVLKLTFFGNVDKSWVPDIIDWIDQIHDFFLDKAGSRRLPASVYYEELFSLLEEDAERYYRHKLKALKVATGLESVYTGTNWLRVYQKHVTFYKLVSEMLTRRNKPDYDEIEAMLLNLR